MGKGNKRQARKMWPRTKAEQKKSVPPSSESGSRTQLRLPWQLWKKSGAAVPCRYTKLNSRQALFAPPNVYAGRPLSSARILFASALPLRRKCRETPFPAQTAIGSRSFVRPARRAEGDLLLSRPRDCTGRGGSWGCVQSAVHCSPHLAAKHPLGDALLPSSVGRSGKAQAEKRPFAGRKRDRAAGNCRPPELSIFRKRCLAVHRQASIQKKGAGEIEANRIARRHWKGKRKATSNMPGQCCSFARFAHSAHEPLCVTRGKDERHDGLLSCNPVGVCPFPLGLHSRSLEQLFWVAASPLSLHILFSSFPSV